MPTRHPVAITLLLSCAFVHADTTLTYDDGGRQSLLRIADGKVRFDNSQDGSWMLFDAASREMTMVEPARREYTVIDEATLDQLQQMMDAALSELQARFSEMPPAMREQMQAMMGGVAPNPSRGGAVRLEATGQRGEAAGYDCRYSHVLVNGEVQSEVCLAPASALDIPAADQAAVRAWQDFARTMAERAGDYVSMDATLLGDEGQLPLIYRHPGSGGHGVLRALTSEAVDPNVMRVPADYREGKIDMPTP